MFKLIKNTLLIIILFTFNNCKGQTKGEEFSLGIQSFGIVVSEFDNHIWKIFQDSKGNYWFGSNGKGIYYLASNQLRQITTKDGLVNDSVRGIQEDSEGNIFIETPHGISKFDGKQFSTLTAIKSPHNQWKLDSNDLWFGYNGNDLFRFDGNSLFELKLPPQDLKKSFGIDTLISPFNTNNPYSVYSVNKDKNGNIWFGTFVAGAFRFDGKSFLWFDEEELSILPDGTASGVRSIIQDKEGYFWLGNFKSKYKITSNHLHYEKLVGIEKEKPYYFNSGIVDTEGNLWMTTFKSGVWKYDGKKLSSFKINKGKKKVLLVSIYQDKSGILWLGTDNDGIYKQVGNSFEKFEINK